MSKEPKWLPALICLEEFSGDWKAYIEAVYAHFKKDFVDNRPYFNRLPVNHKRLPREDDKESTFWHVVTQDEKEFKERFPQLRRCERIRWPRPIIENYEDSRVKAWRNRRRNESRVVLWFENYDYVVVLAERDGYLLLWTAYYVDYPHTRKKLMKEYHENINTVKAKAAL